MSFILTGHDDHGEAFDKSGFIIRQAAFSDISYGRKMSDYNGCGWIAAYNYLRLRGYDVGWREINRKMSGCTLLFGLLGTNPLRLARLLRREYERVRLCFSPGKAVGRALASGCGILMYWHGSGAHFTAFRASYGRLAVYNLRGISYFENFSDFIRRVSKFPLICLITPEAAVRS